MTCISRASVFVLVCVLCVPALAQEAAEHAAKPGAATPSADQTWKDLAAGNKRFAAGKSRTRDDVARRQQLAQGQKPEVAVLSCSDSRVPPEIVFDQGLGELFVVRSAGNSADPLAIGSLEYAVEHLGTTMIVVLGHESCGAVTAACSGEKMPTANLEAVVAPVGPSCTAAKSEKDSGDVIDQAVRDHVHRTAVALLANSSILKHASEEGKLTVVEAYYGLDNGLVTRLR
jgi:carbonic anhydrase